MLIWGIGIRDFELLEFRVVSRGHEGLGLLGLFDLWLVASARMDPMDILCAAVHSGPPMDVGGISFVTLT